MKSSYSSPITILTLTLLLSTPTIHARRGLNPEDLSRLTHGTDYTFHSICADYKNPDLFFFDEWDLSRTIQAITNDLNMYMWGSSTSSSSSPHTLPAEMTDDARKAPLKYQAGGGYRWQRPSPPSEPQAPMERGGKGRGKPIDCRKFQRDLRDFSTSFQKMVYAISEKCYRQCEPNGYVAHATSGLQMTFESHYNGGFYCQVREIEAETGCRFSDTFLIEPERAVDYSKVWIETFQRGERPCAELGR